MSNPYFMETFARTGVIFERGQGSTLYDVNGKDYIDFFAGIAVSSLGHGDPDLVKAISEQAAKLLHCCNYYENLPANQFAEGLCKATGMARVFFSNSGAESNEGAIKLARKYAKDKGYANRTKILTLEKSFHGRTITTLAATGQESFHRFFDPFTPGFDYVFPGSINDMEKAMSHDDVIAVMLEPIQGESGVNLLKAEYLQKVQALCREKDVLLILDEVQTGIGRTGYFLAAQGLGIEPDIVTLAKGIAGGIPAGAVLCSEKLAHVFHPGEHGTTFGGGPLMAAAGNVVLKKVNDPAFLAEVTRKGERIKQGIRDWGFDIITEVRGQGLMIGAQVKIDPHFVMEEALKAGVALLTAGSDVVRIMPPLSISDAEMEEGLKRLKQVFSVLNGSSKK